MYTFYTTYHFRQQKLCMLYPRDGFHQKIELIFDGLLLVISLTQSFGLTGHYLDLIKLEPSLIQFEKNNWVVTIGSLRFRGELLVFLPHPSSFLISKLFFASYFLKIKLRL